MRPSSANSSTRERDSTAELKNLCFELRGVPDGKEDPGGLLASELLIEEAQPSK